MKEDTRQKETGKKKEDKDSWAEQIDDILIQQYLSKNLNGLVVHTKQGCSVTET